jgi:purine-nucleoside phosphorylase
MTIQRKKIIESVDFIKKFIPAGFKPALALIKEKDMKLTDDFKVLSKIDYKKIPPAFGEYNVDKPGYLEFVKHKGKDIIVMNGRFHFFDGVSMRNLGHIIYVLKSLGVNKIISLDEVAHLNPRFKCGELALIYDHINLMGDNPLIGENDDKLGIRFPDMSNAYDISMFKNAFAKFLNAKMKINESVYLGIIGPESETEAEARFYRDIGADVLGYSFVPENITAVHCKIKFFGIGLITRGLIADKMRDDVNTLKEMENLRLISKRKAEIELNKIIDNLIDI